jgi:hypothetical protein
LVNSASNSARIVKGILLVGVVLLAGGAFAANRGSLELLHPAEVGGTQLPAGVYDVQWDGSGDQVQLNVLRGKKTVASTSARIVQVETPSDSDNAIVNKNDDGSMSLTQIHFRGKKYALEIKHEGGGAAGAAGAGR